MIPIPSEMVPQRITLLLVSALAVACLAAPPGSHGQSAPNPEAAFADAVQLHEQRLYADAMTAFAAFRDAHPTHVLAGEALYLQAQSALAQGRDDDAVRLFEALQATYPSHPQGPDARLGLAQYYLNEGDAQAAERQLESVIADGTDAQAARALYLRATTARDQGNLTAALRDFRRAHEQYPDTERAPAALYGAGATQVQLERYDAAAASFERLGDRYPNSPYAQNLGTALAEVYYRLDNYEQALSALSGRISALSGDERARGLFLLAESHNQLGQGEDAVASYRRVIDEHPNSPYVAPAHYGLAWHYYQTDQFEQAADAFARVRDGSDPSLAARATYYEAASRAQAGAPAEALALYQQVPTQLPDHRLAAEALYEAGLLLYQQENYEDAAAAFRTVTEQHSDSPRHGDAAEWLGNALLASENLDGALQAYEQARSLDAAPDSLVQEIQFREGWAHYRNQRYDAAASTFLSLADAHPQSSRGADALFWGADSQYNQGNVSQARRLFQRYLDRYPEGAHRAGAQYALAWTHFKQERYQAAARLFQQFLDTYDGTGTDIPYQQDARLRLADAYFALKQYDDAVALYRQIGGDGADYATYQTAEALNYAGRPDDAIRTLEDFIAQYPSSSWQPEAQYRLGSIHFQEQDYESARAAYRRFLDAYPDNQLASEAQYNIADSYYNAGSMEEAVEAYRTVIEQYPSSATANEAASSLFFALSAAGRQDRSDDLIASIADGNSELEDQLRFHRARAAFQSGESERALSLFRDFVRTASADTYLPDTYYYLGQLYADQEQYTEATNYLQQLVDQYPESDQLPDGALRLGEIYLDQENYEASLDAYRAAAESNQTGAALQARARYGEAVALMRLGRNDEAAAQLNTLLDASDQGPLQASARLGLARIAADEGRTEEALDLYRAVVDASDGETGAEALYRLGRLLRQQGRPRPAIQELDRVSSLFGGYPEWIARSLLEQGRAYRQLGETGQAAQLFEDVVDSYPGTPFADSAQTARDNL
jgi:TolA-binding protein